MYSIECLYRLVRKKYLDINIMLPFLAVLDRSIRTNVHSRDHFPFAASVDIVYTE